MTLATGDTLARLQDAVSKSPEDWQLRLVYADALEESGGDSASLGDDVLAAAQRWMAANHRRAYNGGRHDTWSWYFSPRKEVVLHEKYLSHLPDSLWQLLENCAKHVSKISAKHYATCQDADRALAQALNKWEKRL